MSWLSPTPHRRRSVTAVVTSALAVALLGAGCATKKTAAPATVATGPGVTDKVIKLGVLTDRTGPFAGASNAGDQGRQLYWSKKNASGGVCGRQVEFVVKDHAYNTKNAVTGYRDIEGDVLAL